MRNSKIDEKIFKELKEGFDYLEEYDRLGEKPDKRVPLTISIPLRLKKKLENKENVSRFVEEAIVKAVG